ncbi:MAG: DEAD/DEAH box helicase, partial [Acidimicrobiia bacterium]|nr:DEAD/DEAH box helicase [Acidimicrobiia bacterium]
LYVPTDQLAAVRPYTGGETPRLSRMGGSDWATTQSNVRKAVAVVAEEVVALHRRRARVAGTSMDTDTPWQAEFESAFPFEETPDQLAAIQDVKRDMERPEPMDRLIFGDVGFGKTEVALRGAFKAVQSGHQVAVLVPTTLLAQQHHTTFEERLANYPVRVEMLSRFLTAAQQRKVIEGVANGSVDIVIGTHRLLSEDVRFARLGLLVVDEEQRFGVNAKDRIKELKASVDVLTLTATPIPRTRWRSRSGGAFIASSNDDGRVGRPEGPSRRCAAGRGGSRRSRRSPRAGVPPRGRVDRVRTEAPRRNWGSGPSARGSGRSAVRLGASSCRRGWRVGTRRN